MSKKKKIRVAFRKNRQNKSRRLPQFDGGDLANLPENVADLPTAERVSGKGSLTRYRTVVMNADLPGGGQGLRNVDVAECLTGRVLSPRGGDCLVQGSDGREYLCTVRRLLKSLSNEERNAVVAGDRVLFRITNELQGMIERVEPRHATLSRHFRRQKHVLVANVDQVLRIHQIILARSGTAPPAQVARASNHSTPCVGLSDRWLESQSSASLPTAAATTSP